MDFCTEQKAGPIGNESSQSPFVLFLFCRLHMVEAMNLCSLLCQFIGGILIS